MEKEIESYYEKVQNNLEQENLEASAIAIRHITEAIATEYVNKYLPAHTFSDTFTKINLLLEKRYISKDSATILHELRQIGNKAAHVNDNNPITKEEIKRCIAPLRMVIDEFYEKMDEEFDEEYDEEYDEEWEVDFTKCLVNTSPENEEKNLGPTLYNTLYKGLDEKQITELETYWEMADNAFMNDCFDQAIENYNKCLRIVPFSSELVFSIAECRYYRESTFEEASNILSESIPNIFYLIKKQYGEYPEYMYSKALNIVDKCIPHQKDLDVRTTNTYAELSMDQKKIYIATLGRTRATFAYALYSLGNQIEKEFGQNEALMKRAIVAWKTGLNIHVDSIGSQWEKEPHRRDIEAMENKVRKYEPSYKAPAESGCYIATAVYNSYDCPEVWTLRRFRDYFLAKTWCGRIFIKIYYYVSPKLVERFKDNEIIKKIVKERLDKLVNKLQLRGYSDRPYFKK